MIKSLEKNFKNIYNIRVRFDKNKLKVQSKGANYDERIYGY